MKCKNFLQKQLSPALVMERSMMLTTAIYLFWIFFDISVAFSDSSCQLTINGTNSTTNYHQFEGRHSHRREELTISGGPGCQVLLTTYLLTLDVFIKFRKHLRLRDSSSLWKSDTLCILIKILEQGTANASNIVKIGRVLPTSGNCAKENFSRSSRTVKFWTIQA